MPLILVNYGDKLIHSYYKIFKPYLLLNLDQSDSCFDDCDSHAVWSVNMSNKPAISLLYEFCHQYLRANPEFKVEETSAYVSIDSSMM